MPLATRVAGLLPAILLVAGVSSPAGAGKIYWSTSSGEIRRAGLDGSNVETVLSGVAARAIAIGGGKLYWAEKSSAKRIRRADIDGANVETVVTGVGSLQALALELTGGKIYWAERVSATTKIRRANLDGSEIEDVVADDYSDIADIKFDVSRGWFYFSDFGYVYRARFDGSDIQELYPLAFSLSLPSGLALDVPGNTLYVANLDGCILRSTPPGATGACITPSYFCIAVAAALAIDLGARELYWSEYCGAIFRKDLDSGYDGQVDQLVSAEEEAQWIALSGICGDGVVDAGEECDDGNHVAGDGCESDCTLPPIDAVPAVSPYGSIAAALLLLAASAVASRLARRA